MVGVRYQHNRAPVWILHCRLPVASAADSPRHRRVAVKFTGQRAIGSAVIDGRAGSLRLRGERGRVGRNYVRILAIQRTSPETCDSRDQGMGARKS